MSTDFNRDSIARAYGRWAPVYDLVFGQVFARGRDAAIVAAERIGGRILEIGVGTGISLPDYSRNNRITGIDISAPMLRKAQQRVRESSPYARALTRAVSAVATFSNVDHPLTTEHENVRRAAVLVVTSDRGLAGAQLLGQSGGL